METATDTQLVTELAREVVASVAPTELPMYRAISSAWQEDRQRPARSGGRDEMLGFGIGEAVALLTPVILAVVRDVLVFLGEEIRKQFKDQASESIRDLIKKLFRRLLGKDEPGAEPALKVTPELAMRVRALALEKGLALRLPEDQARLLADALVGGLSAADR